MSGVSIAEARSPYVMFERRAEEDRARTIEEGRYVAKDVDYALITPYGSRDQIERVVSEWIEHLKNEGQQGRIPANWHKAYREAYEAWKEGKSIPLEGTAIINWPPISPAQVATLQAAHVLTVEQLAVATEEIIGRLGMGGRALVRLAVEYIAQTNNGSGKAAGKIVALETELAAQKEIAEKQSATINALTQQMQMLQANQNQPPQAPPPVPTAAPTGPISANDLLGDGPGTGLTKL